MKRHLLLGFILLTIGLRSLALDEAHPALARDFEFQFSNTNVSAVNALLVKPDGRIVLASEGRQSLPVCLESDGSELAGAFPITNASLALTAEGTVLMFGRTAFESLEVGGRSTDPAFYFSSQYFDGEIDDVLVDSRGGILFSGKVRHAGEPGYSGFLRFHREQVRDEGFQHTNTAGLTFTSAVLGSDDSIIAAYSRTNAEAMLVHGMGRWHSNGVPDLLFEGVPDGIVEDGERISLLTPRGNSIFGVLLKGDGTNRQSRIVEFRSNGEFVRIIGQPVIGEVRALETLVLQGVTARTNGWDELVLGGDFSQVDDKPATHLAALRPDGSPAWAADTNSGPNAPVLALARQLDGRLLVGGKFNEFGGVPARGLVRLCGANGQGRTFVHWARPEFQVFEKLGAAELVVTRTGDLNEGLRLRLEVNGQEVSDRRRVSGIPAAIEFLPDAAQARFRVTIGQDVVSSPRESIRLTMAAESDSGAVITRATADLAMLDDDTAGAVDAGFVTPVFTNTIQAIAVAPDGKVLVSHGWSDGKLVRLNVDGSLDASFRGMPTNLAGWVTQIEMMPDDRILIAGRFLEVPLATNGLNGLAMLHPDGSLDASFLPRNPRTDRQPYVTVQPDGKIIVGGVSPRLSSLARLKGDGSIDTSFGFFSGSQVYFTLDDLLSVSNEETFVAARTALHRLDGSGRVAKAYTLSGSVWHLARQGEWVVVGGSFNRIDGVPLRNMGRIKLADGAVDPTFRPNLEGVIKSMKATPDGKILVAGRFTEVQGKRRLRIARLNADGSLDETFDPGRGLVLMGWELAIQPDGKPIVGGMLDYADGAPVTNIVRLENPARGRIRFLEERVVAAGSNSVVKVAVVRVDGSLGAMAARLRTIDGGAKVGEHYASQDFTIQYGDGEYGRKIFEVALMARTVSAGDRSFSMELETEDGVQTLPILIEDGRSGSVSADSPSWSAAITGVRDVDMPGDGSVLLSGSFDGLNGIPVTNMARLGADFSIDTNFLAGGSVRPISSTVVDALGLTYYAGIYVRLTQQGFLGRISPDGKLDTTFGKNTSATFDAMRTGLTLPVDVQVSGEGAIMQRDGLTIRWFDLDGMHMPSRDMAIPKFGRRSQDVLVKTVGRSALLFGAWGTNGLVAGKTDEFWQTNFSVVLGTSTATNNQGLAEAIVEESSGTVLFGGNFGFANGHQAAGLARVFPDGTVDTNFAPSIGKTVGLEHVFAILPLPSGDIVVGGSFEQVDGVPQRCLALLDVRGRMRTDFRPVLKGRELYQVMQLSDGGLLVRGSITNVNDAPVNTIFKLDFRDAVPPVAQAIWPTNGTILRKGGLGETIYFDGRGYDPDGLPQRLELRLDGEVLAMTTNATRLRVPRVLSELGLGEHRFEVVVEDDRWLRRTNVSSFTVSAAAVEPWVKVLGIEAQEIELEWQGRLLLESDNLNDWTEVERSAGSRTIRLPIGTQRFFRVVN